MNLDYSIEYDCCFEEFKGKKVLEVHDEPMWIAVHTEKAQKFMYDTFGLCMALHKRMKFINTYVKQISSALKKENLSGSYGGFYYTNIEHTKTIDNK